MPRQPNQLAMLVAILTPTHQRRALLLEAMPSAQAEHVTRGNVCYSHQVGSHDAGLPVAEDPDLNVRFLPGGQLPVLCPAHQPLAPFHVSNASTGVGADKPSADLRPRVIYQKHRKQPRALGIEEPGE